MSMNTWRLSRPNGYTFSLAKRRTWYAEGETPATPVPPEKPAPETQPSGAVDSGENKSVPDWVKDPAKAYEEIQKLRLESEQKRKESRELEKRLEKIEQSKTQEETAKLEADKKWEELATKRAQELETLKSQLAARDLDSLKLKVGTEFKLSPKLVARLQGATEDELRADAADLAKDLGLDKAQAETASTAADKATIESNPARGQSTTTAVPGGQPVNRTDADRKKEYFRPERNSPIYSGGKMTVNGKATDPD